MLKVGNSIIKYSINKHEYINEEGIGYLYFNDVSYNAHLNEKEHKVWNALVAASNANCIVTDVQIASSFCEESADIFVIFANMKMVYNIILGFCEKGMISVC